MGLDEKSKMNKNIFLVAGCILLSLSLLTAEDKLEQPKFKSKEEEAEFWMRHDTADFWDSFEDLKALPEISSRLEAQINARHERTKAISLRLYPSQIRAAKAIANRNHIPYQTILRQIIEQGLSHWAA